VQNNLNAELSHKNTAETDIFTMTKGEIRVCHGKKCRRVIFLTMREALFMKYHGKTAKRASRGNLQALFCCLLSLLN